MNEEKAIRGFHWTRKAMIDFTRLHAGYAILNALGGTISIDGKSPKPCESIDHLIVGGESGPHARLMDPEWARRILLSAREFGTPFFFKQMTGRGPIPSDLFVREFPEMETT